ncbi:hypothetical protein FACS1894125_1380 [Actinomycetota bacterium]|nr:hypothetical protein FACS1894125_1380 [Actinomycetota bacterium]
MAKFTKYNSADYLDCDEAIEIYVEEALKTNNDRLIDYAFDVVTRAKNISKEAALRNIIHSEVLLNA